MDVSKTSTECRTLTSTIIALLMFIQYHGLFTCTLTWPCQLWLKALNNIMHCVAFIHAISIDISKCIFLNENVYILIKILLKFVLKGLINNITALVQIMAWRRPGDKPSSEPMMISLVLQLCVPIPQWVKPVMVYNLKVILHYATATDNMLPILTTVMNYEHNI